VVVDFEMNKVCAAGTGSFLEEQAEKLNINIVEEFGDMALQSECPLKMGDRCTVFMESDLNSYMQKERKMKIWLRRPRHTPSFIFICKGCGCSPFRD
jgi:activator of 2-hydroxyglutaryl-CoA dehydratase